MLKSLIFESGYGKLRILGMLAVALFGLNAQAHSQCSNPANPVVAENCLPGTSPSVWDINGQGTGDLTIQGFSTDISVNLGGTVNFKIDTPAHAYTIDIYRMGYYQGNGARYITSVTPSVTLPQAQPACLQDPATGATDCGNWAVSASWTVPTTAVSGIYFAHLTRTDTGGDSQIVFIVRNDSSTSKILYQTSDSTWQAYNYYGNGSLYGPYGTMGLGYRTYAVSYNRPVLTRGFDAEAATFVFGAEYAMVQWLEANGYDVSYSTALDADRNGSLILNHSLYMDSGHDEYVSAGMRANIKAARDAGVNLAFFSGNEFFWKTRWANSLDGTNTPYRTLVCYKETLAFAKLDPQDPPTWTGTWRDPTFSPPADGGQPENGLTGTLFMVNGPASDNSGNLSMSVPQADGQMRFWRNTAVASLAPGATYTMVPGSLGYEWDVDADNGFRPAGAFHLSTTTYPLTADYLLDYGATYGAGIATHHMMMYRAPSGALVFGAGTIDWAYGLTSNHDNPFNFPTPDPDINMEQATVNLFADMGIQPATLQSGLSPASASTDTVAPHSVITYPTNGAALSTGSTVMVTGTATDSGGQVAGVEFSGDGGVTWHPAIGRANWSYNWTPTATGSSTLLSRAVDDSANLEIPSNGIPVTIAPQTCPCTIFGQNTPINADSGDGNSIEVGVKFRADADGSILGVRFYKAPTNTGTHMGHVWTDSGQLLGTATFSGESASGWQQVNFSTPIPATANTVYVVSYLAPAGHYSADPFAFQTAGVDNPPLHALQNGVDGADGVYTYGPSGGFPTSSFNAANYWVDVIYSSSDTYSVSGNISGYGGPGSSVTLSGPETLTTVADVNGNFSFDGVVNGTYSVTASNPGVSFVPPSQNVTVSFGTVTGVDFAATVVNPLTISGNIAGGAGATVNLAGAATASTTADVNGNYSFTGLLNGSYTVTPVEAGDIFQPATAPVTLSGSSNTGVNFQGQVCDCISIFPASDTPAIIDSGDGNSTELGVLFTADSSAYLTGIKFYKAATNTGTHVGHLWSSTGTLLGTATFPSETGSGWQTGYFEAPVYINANTPYVASYFAPNGHYSATSNFFASSGIDSPPLHALQNGIDGPNGIYLYSSSGGFPNNTYNSTNYWVDVLYAAEPYSISGTILGPGGAGATVSLSGGSGQVTTTADSFGNYTFSPVYTGSYSITPSLSGYVFSPGIQSVIVSQANVTNVDFTVPQLCPCETVWSTSAAPTKVDSGDPASLEVGVKVRADSDGYVLGVRFYKASANTGAHIGNLWSETSGAGSGSESGSGSGTGSLLSTASFVGESASGWQQVLFANPVPIVANTTYVASYFAPSGHYSGDDAFFANGGVDNPPLHALENGVDGPNGVFAYGQQSSYPSSSYDSANYWVDIIYATNGTYTIAGNVSGAGATGATVTLSGAATGTAITDANGNYSFPNIANGNYIVTVSESGFIYTPASQNVVINGAHNLGVNFVGAVPTYALSGTVSGAPGITVSLAGSATQTTIADVNGSYSFTVPNGSYTITPTSFGFSFNPTSLGVTVNGAPVSGVNFSATQIYFSISGVISGGAGATVNLVGASTITTTADSFGNYSFTGISSGAYTVVPVIAEGVVFSPANQAVTLVGANVTGVNFAVPQNCPCDTIWPSAPVPVEADSGDGNSVEVGVKFTASADAYISGLRFYKAATNTGTHVGHIWTDTGVLLGTATFVNESSSGWQQVLFSAPIPVSANTNYVASYFAPAGHYSADAGYFSTSGVSTPPLQALQNGVDGPNGVYGYSSMGGFPNQNTSNNAFNYWVDVIYTPTTTFSVTGTVGGLGGPGSTVTLSGNSAATTTADPSGNFEFDGLANGSYVVTPSANGYLYTPATQNATINNAHALGLVFNSNAGSFTISGTISGPGGTGALVNLTGAATATTFADPTGAFSFPGVTDGSYTVSASSSGYLMTPASQSVTVLSGNATANFVSALPSILGVISGPGGSGATVTLSGPASATTTADAAGTFSFPGLPNGAYSVAVGNPGFAFTPASQAVTLSGANVTVTISSIQLFGIIGTISGPGGNGATVTLSGAASATTTASATGSFSFTGLYNGAYTVAVSNPGFVYTPPSQAVTVSSANAPVTFSSAQLFSITGTISGVGVSGATVTLSGAASETTTTSATGTYTFTGLLNGAYTVAASNLGSIITPASQAVTVNGANANANFFSALQPYTITGTITGPGASGATITLSGAASATTTTSTTGTYTFTGLYNGSYTVAASRAGYAFTPASQVVTVTYANATANFSSQKTYGLTGTISGAGGPGATVTLSGGASATATASPTGTYSFFGLVNGSYSVAATNAGYLITPVSHAVTVNGANATANFTAAKLYTITGTINGAGGIGAKVTLSGAASATTTTSSTGTYTFSSLLAGSYTVTPSNPGYFFTPGSTVVNITTANATANFTASPLTYTLSGTISGPGGNGATVKLTGTLAINATANIFGQYSFTVTAGTYTVTPSKTGYVYTPTSQSVTVTNAAVVENFNSAVQTFTISGTISGAGGNGATVKLTGTATATVTANSLGAYTFTGLLPGSYTLTPGLTGYVFTPANQAVTISTINVTANFTSAVATYSISGTISGAGGNGATVSLSGAASATTTASATGTYSFTGLPAGAYTVTPSKAGYVFTPANHAISITNASLVENFSSALQTFTLTGTVSGAGSNSVTVKLTGAATATTTANSSGAYTFSGLVPGTYNVTPSATGYNFTPANQAVTITTAAMTANFSVALTSNTFELQNVASGLALNVSGASKADNAQIIQYPWGSGSTNAEWKFTATSNGYYQLVNVNSGYDAVVQGASTTQGAKIVQYTFGTSGDDQWKPTQNSDGSYTFTNLHSGMVLEDPNFNTANGTQMDQWASNGGTNQHWLLTTH